MLWLLLPLLVLPQLSAQTLSREVLPSGLTVVVVERPLTPVVAVEALVRSGSQYESALLGSGISALAQRVQLVQAPPEMRAAERRTGAQVETTLSDACASYRLTTTPDRLDDAVQALALTLRVVDCDERVLQRERERLLLEQEQALSDPDRAGLSAVAATVYQAHPARLPLLGRRDATLALTLDDVRRYLRRRYTAPNVVLVVVGNVRTERVLQASRAAFAYFPEGSYDRSASFAEPPQYAQRLRTQAARLPLQRVYLAWRTVPMEHVDQDALEILARSLAAPGSLLRTRLEGEGRASALQVRNEYGPGRPGYVLLSYEVRPEQRHDALKAVGEVLALLLQDDSAFVNTIDAVKLQLQRERRSRSAADIARAVGLWELAIATPSWDALQGERLDQVSATQVREVLARYCTSTQLSRVTLRAEELGPAPSDDPGMALTAVEPEVSQYNNGLRTITQPGPFGLVHIRLTLGGGSSFEDQHSQGATALLARLLGQATENRSAEQLRSELGRRGMNLQVEASTHALHLGLTCFPDDLSDGLTFLSEALLAPAFSAEQVELMRQQTRERLLLDERFGTWQQRLAQTMRSTLLAGHYGARAREGTPDSLADLDREVLRTYLRTLLVGGNTVLTVLGGPFDVNVVRSFVRGTLEEVSFIPAGSQCVAPLDPALPLVSGAAVKLTGDRAESAIGLGWYLPGQDAPATERAASDVLVALLGGAQGRGGRLGAALGRVGDGAVVSSVLSVEHYQGRSILLLRVLAAELQLEAVRKEVMDELARLNEDLIAESEPRVKAIREELAAARAVCLTRQSRLQEDQSQLANEMAELLLTDGNLQALNQASAQIAQIDRAAMRGLLQRFVTQPACVVLLTPPAPEPVAPIETPAPPPAAVDAPAPVVIPAQGAPAPAPTTQPAAAGEAEPVQPVLAPPATNPAPATP